MEVAAPSAIVSSSSGSVRHGLCMLPHNWTARVQVCRLAHPLDFQLLGVIRT